MRQTAKVLRFDLDMVDIELVGMHDTNLVWEHNPSVTVKMRVPFDVLPRGVEQGDEFTLVIQGQHKKTKE